MKKPITDWNKFRDQFVRETLRRASFRWPPRSEAIKKARTERKTNPATGKLNWHVKCANCHEEVLEKEGRVDHVEPVVPVNKHNLQDMRKTLSDPKYTGLDLGSYVSRMFPEAGGFQMLCTHCHHDKTARESFQRAEQRKLTREGGPRAKGRSGKTNVEFTSLESLPGIDKGVNLRGQEVLSKWLEDCPECKATVYIRVTETFICPKCRRVVRS
jgi:hypothetical protein